MTTATRVAVSVVLTGVVLGSVYLLGVRAESLQRDRGFVIDRIEQQVHVQADGRSSFEEELEVSVTEPRRGIARPLALDHVFGYSGGYGIRAALQGEPLQPTSYVYEPASSGGLQIRTGDADTTLEVGTHRFGFSYVAPTRFHEVPADPDLVELHLEVPGFGWPTTVADGHLELQLPGPAREVTCVAGPPGTDRPCSDLEVVADDLVRVSYGPLDDHRSAMLTVRLDLAAFDVDGEAAGQPAGYLPVGERVLPPPGGTTSLPERSLDVIGAPWHLTRPEAALLLALLLAVPIVLWEKLSSWVVYRDRVSDPGLHGREHPTAVFTPPFGLQPAEIAGLRLRTDDDEILLATLVDLDQRGVLSIRRGRDLEDVPDQPGPRLLITRGTDYEVAHPTDTEVADAIVPDGALTILDSTYREEVAGRVNRAKRILTGRRRSVFEAHGFLHDRGQRLARPGVRQTLLVLYLGVAVALAWVVSASTELPGGTASAVVLLVLGGWAGLALLWREQRRPLNSEGRDAVAQARAFERFLRSVEAEQLRWASSDGNVDHRHPAVRLLPYAIALGLADAWYDRFGGVFLQLDAVLDKGWSAGMVASAADRRTSAWWLLRGTYRNIRMTHRRTAWLRGRGDRGQKGNGGQR